MKLSIREMVFSGLMIAMSTILSLPILKIMGSIGLDAIPGLFSAVTVGPVYGGAIGALAHMITAIMTGFPSTIPVHIVISAGMFVTCYAYGYTRKKFNSVVAIIVAVMINGPVVLLAASVVAQYIGIVPDFRYMFAGFIIPLSLASVINAIIAEVVVMTIGIYVRRFFEVDRIG